MYWDNPSDALDRAQFEHVVEQLVAALGSWRDASLLDHDVEWLIYRLWFAINGEGGPVIEGLEKSEEDVIVSLYYNVDGLTDTDFPWSHSERSDALSSIRTGAQSLAEQVPRKL
jgi:hypothetical protein